MGIDSTYGEKKSIKLLSEVKRPLGRPWYKRVDNIKMGITGRGCDNANLPQARITGGLLVAR